MEGSKAGLQSRLAEQEANISQVVLTKIFAKIPPHPK